ncbi:hypothetical protein B0H14DRAFT_233438 [Mycena olivaceomarginata]|nr:hypothetical protein B0H14DRAFT_233438 [Mycena olivaceomarginata]
MSLPLANSDPTVNDLQHIPSHASHDIPMVSPPVPKSDDAIYDRFSPRRKVLITCVVSFCSFLARCHPQPCFRPYPSGQLPQYDGVNRRRDKRGISRIHGCFPVFLGTDKPGVW